MPKARMEHEFQPCCSLFLNYCNVKIQPISRDRFQKCDGEIFKLPSRTKVRLKVSRAEMNDDQNSPAEDQQFIVDDYLEHIDRRYKRMHPSDTTNGYLQKSFTSVLGWLTSEDVKRRNKEDALCVLGLAEHASVRLLQKHRLPIAQTHRSINKNEETVIVDDQVEKSATSTPFMRIVPIAQSSNLMKKMYNYHRVVILMQLKVWFYSILRLSVSTITHFLAVLSIMFGCIPGEGLVPPLVTILAGTVIITHQFRAQRLVKKIKDHYDAIKRELN